MPEPPPSLLPWPSYSTRRRYNMTVTYVSVLCRERPGGSPSGSDRGRPDCPGCLSLAPDTGCGWCARAAQCTTREHCGGVRTTEKTLVPNGLASYFAPIFFGVIVNVCVTALGKTSLTTGCRRMSY